MAQPHLCLINSMRTWGGAEVWFLETALALTKRGHRVSVVAQPDSELLERCQKNGLQTLPLAIRFDAAPWTLAKLHWFFRKNKITSILANLTKDLKAASVAGRIAGVPIILGSRESDFPLKNKLYYRWYFNKMATGILVNSQATKTTVVESAPWLDQDKIHLLYKGIDLEKFCMADQAPSYDLGFAGQYIPRKGLASLMQAWSLLENDEESSSLHQPTGPTLHLVGEGPLKASLHQWKESLLHPQNVTIDGPTDNMPAFYQNIGTLVMPSLSEGFGLVAAEASACGVPVIASNTSSLPEIITHEQTGLLVPVNDPTKLAQAMKQLLENPEKSRQYGRGGRQFVQQNFDRENTLDRLEKLTGLGQ